MDENFRNIAWGEVLERLTLVACRLFGLVRFARDTEKVLESFGTGPGDFASQVILSLLDPDDSSVTWNQDVYGEATTAGVVRYLETVMRNDYRDKAAARRRKGQEPLYVRSDDDGEDKLSLDPADPTMGAEEALVDRSAVELLKKRLDDDLAARPDVELQRYVNLLFEDERCLSYKPGEMAAALELPVERVYLVKERLGRRVMRLSAQKGSGLRANLDARGRL